MRFHQYVPQPEQPVAATLRALSPENQSVVAPLLAQALEDCGGCVRERSGSAWGLFLTFEVPLRMMSELYGSLMECGLEFDRRGQCELTLLCTLARHAPEPEALRRSICLRLDLTFGEEFDSVSRPAPPVFA